MPGGAHIIVGQRAVRNVASPKFTQAKAKKIMVQRLRDKLEKKKIKN